MIKRLRYRFIALAMASLLLVLAVIIGVINVLNYRSIVAQADDLLGLLADNNGRFPMIGGGPMGGPGRKNDRMSSEAPFENRYFSVLFDESGSVKLTDVGMVAAVGRDAAESYAESVYKTGKEKGFSDSYRFIRRGEGSDTRLIFLDCTRSLNTFYGFLRTSLLISAFGLAAVFFLVTVLSGRIVRPVSESYEKQKQFITDAGHEIKTPLTIIDADAELLAMECGESEWLSDIRVQTSRLAALTNDLISLSRMEEGNMRLNMIDFPFSDTVEEVVQTFHGPAKLQGKSIDVSIEPMLSFCGDQAALRQLVNILMDNAVKYSPEGGDIKVSLESKGSGVSLSVENSTAEPIEKESLSRFFDRFYRGDPSRSSKISGHGIGLSIAKAVVQAHKGRITATAPEDSRLLINVTLP